MSETLAAKFAKTTKKTCEDYGADITFGLCVQVNGDASTGCLWAVAESPGPTRIALLVEELESIIIHLKGAIDGGTNQGEPGSIRQSSEGGSTTDQG